jgi:hypothetical protein
LRRAGIEAQGALADLAAAEGSTGTLDHRGMAPVERDEARPDLLQLVDVPGAEEVAPPRGAMEVRRGQTDMESAMSVKSGRRSSGRDGREPRSRALSVMSEALRAAAKR